MILLQLVILYFFILLVTFIIHKIKIISNFYPKINILTRSNFKNWYCLTNLVQSIDNSDYKNWYHIISTENMSDEGLEPEVKISNLQSDKRKIITVAKNNEPCDTKGHKKSWGGNICCPYNLYLNDLLRNTKPGWVLVIDDDAKIVDKSFLGELARICSQSDPKEIIIFQAYLNRQKKFTPYKKIWGEGLIDMCSFCFHYSVPKIFDNICGGDWRFIRDLVKMGYKVRYHFDLPHGVWGNYSGKANGKFHSCYRNKNDILLHKKQNKVMKNKLKNPTYYTNVPWS